MKKLMLAAVLALGATAQAEAAPHFTPTYWFTGSWTCTIAQAPNTKLFMTLSSFSARAAVREYPYYGKTEFKLLSRGPLPSFTSVAFRGSAGYLSLRRGRPGVLTGSGRIGTTAMQLTCSRS
jgi:hypothetical protein